MTLQWPTEPDRYTESMRSSPPSRKTSKGSTAGEPDGPCPPQFAGPMWQTPAMKQYVRFKTAHPECLLLFRMGDFYELFGEDAVTAHEALGITLTERTKGMPMAGVPHHAMEGYLRRLVEGGYRVAICEQVQDPKDAKGVVDRAVTRVLTPGTLVDESMLDDAAPNHLAAIHRVGDRAVIATAELSTGAFDIHDVPEERLIDELTRIGPAELIISELSGDEPDWVVQLEALGLAPLSRRAEWTFQIEHARRLLESFHGVQSLEAFGLAEHRTAIEAAGALLQYLRETQGPGTDDDDNTTLGHLQPPRLATEHEHLVIDATSLRSLEIAKTMRAGTSEGTLLSVLQRGRTPMGRRLLREWLCWPLRDRERIENRHRAIGAFIEDDEFSRRVRTILDGIQDVARIGSRISMGRATPRDVVGLGQSLSRLVELTDELDARPAFDQQRTQLVELGLQLVRIEERIQETCVEAPPSHLRAGGLFRDGTDETLDEARLLQRDANTWLAQYQARIIEETAIPSLKVGFNKVFGYYIELSRINSEKAPDSFTRKQTLKNAERFITPELKSFEEKVTTAESRALERERDLFAELCAAITEQTIQIAEFARQVAEVDCLLGLSEVAARRGWSCPKMSNDPGLSIQGGRHPVLESMLKDSFVPNDCALACSEHPPTLALITGPNMAGKSTFIRQVALIALLAHAGAWVPADEARIGMMDRILTRIGASDELHTGRSTFMVEMTETANILHHATDRSLIILDEIGRGTSTLDGLSLAWAITETLAKRGAPTLFATHYHEITSLADSMEAVSNLHVTVREWNDQIIFLHRIQPGRTDRSYGIHVARLAGLPKETLERAQQVLDTLVVNEVGAPDPTAATDLPDQMSLFQEFVPDPIVNTLRELSLEALSPMEAFDILRKLSDELKRRT
ncbi:MAG: DNA mismatch repair protein MutS [Planctomycetes bacterium TMED75]|nr:DNA mismatch repair protein MutS [Planctomycetaceae bacterium]OUU90688.1 MAG: DNA mismatch repair protein MutS [Planctomycetes bacterium TMED75]